MQPDRVLRSPVRQRMIARMRETGEDYSARDLWKEMSERGEVDEPESNFDYHFRLLREHGFLGEVDTARVRGASKVTCRPTGRAVLDDSARMSLIAEVLQDEAKNPHEVLHRIRWIVADSGRGINE